MVMYYIYKLTDCNNLVYYSSSENVDERFKGHMRTDNKCSSNKLDRLSMEVEVIETLPEDSTKKDARIRERWYFDNNECVNEYRPYVSDGERKQQHNERMKDYSKNYYAENKEKQSVIDSRRRAELTRRGTQHYKDYMEKYRQDQIDSFNSLTTEEQETITEMKREDRRRYAENRKIKSKKEKESRQL